MQPNTYNLLYDQTPDPMQRFDVTAIGELNVDLIMGGIESFPEVGKEKYAHRMLLTLGSSTAIFAANTAALGTSTAFAGMIGRDTFGGVVKDSLRRQGVDTCFVVESERTTTGVTVVMNYADDRANLTYPGAMDELRLKDLDPTLFDRTRHIHLSSLFMQAGLSLDLDALFEKAMEKGMTLSLDTQWDPSEQWNFDLRKYLPMIDLFMPNQTELIAMTHTHSLDEAIRYIIPFIKHAAVIKCGAQGSLLVLNDGRTIPAPAYTNRQVVDTVGAGDSFNAGFIHAFIRGCDLEECQRLGNLMGALNTTAAGGTGAFSPKETISQRIYDLFGEQIDL